MLGGRLGRVAETQRALSLSRLSGHSPRRLLAAPAGFKGMTGSWWEPREDKAVTGQMPEVIRHCGKTRAAVRLSLPRGFVHQCFCNSRSLRLLDMEISVF